MEITNEIKVKVFAQYLGQKIMLSDHSIWTGFYCEVAIIKHLEKEAIGQPKLILKPLSAITDEDKAWIANLFEWKEVVNISVGAFLVELVKSEYNLYRADKTIIAVQYIQSKGYDLPNYLLNGKTLHEAGLAIYQ